MQRVAFYRPIVQSIRFASAVPKVGPSPPPLEEWDPLNPGQWQLGTGGKLVPRLPEGTRVGSLTMGKYGLYDAKLRAKVDAFYEAVHDHGHARLTPPEELYPPFRKHKVILNFLAIACLFTGLYNIATLIHGKTFWPFTGTKRR